MQLLSVFSLFTLAVSSAYGSAIDTTMVDDVALDVNLESRSTCSTSDVNFIKGRAQHYNVFCQMYNAQSRTSSPFLLLDHTRTAAACKCILAVYNGKATSTSAPAASAPTCVSADKNLIIDEYNYPPAFCSWWNSIYRTRSPIPGVSAAEVTKACKCYAAATASKATTAAKVTSTSKKTTATAKATTAAACKRKVRKVRRVAAPEPTVLEV